MVANNSGSSQAVGADSGKHSSGKACGVHTRRTTTTRLMLTCLVACSVLFVDQVLLEWAPGAWVVSAWLTQDSNWVYVVMLCGGYALLFSGGFAGRSSDKLSGCSLKKPQKNVESTALQKRRSSGDGNFAPRAVASPNFKEGASSRTSPGSVARLNSMLSQASVRDGPRQTGEHLQRLVASGWECDATSFAIVIRAFAKNGELKHAEQWLDTMSTYGVHPNEQCYISLMSACAKADDVEACERWMGRMEKDGLKPTVISYTLLIHAFARLGNMSRAETWLQRMADAGVEPDTANYNSLIHACSLQCKAEMAERWFQDMKKRNLEPTVMTYTALIDACAKSLDVNRAEKWLDDMLELGIEPNVVSYSTMINACAKVGNLERAEHWYCQMQERGVEPNAYSYSALINACAQVADVETACSWLERAQNKGAILDGVVYGCVINACGKVGDGERAMKVFRDMRARGVKTHVVVYSALARPFAYLGDWEEVERIAEEMVADGIPVNDYFLYTLLLGYSRAKPRQAARAEAAFVKAGVEPNDRILKALTCAVGKTRCQQLVDMGMFPDGWLKPSSGCAYTGRPLATGIQQERRSYDRTHLRQGRRTENAYSPMGT